MEPRKSGLLATRKPDDWTLGRAEFDRALAQTTRDSLEIKDPLTGSEWAERHGIEPNDR